MNRQQHTIVAMLVALLILPTLLTSCPCNCQSGRAKIDRTISKNKEGRAHACSCENCTCGDTCHCTHQTK